MNNKYMITPTQIDLLFLL